MRALAVLSFSIGLSGLGCGDSTTPLHPDAAIDAAPAAVCGDHIIQAPEECDDGNAAANDGCTGCTMDHAPHTITASWAIKTTAGAVQPCPGGFDTAAVYSQRLDIFGDPVGTPVIDLYDCVTGTGTTAPLTGGYYAAWIEIATHDNTSQYAKSTSADVDLTTTDKAFNATILTDGGYFGFAWNLTKMSNGQPLTCAQVAGLTGIESIATDVANSSNFASDIFDCADGEGITAGFLAGTYTVHIDALNSSNQSIGDAADLTNKVIQAPNKVTDLGTVTIPITGL